MNKLIATLLIMHASYGLSMPERGTGKRKKKGMIKEMSV